MRSLVCLSLIPFAFTTQCAFAQVLVWPLSQGGNGHFYQAFTQVGGMTWSKANWLATNSGGYLATVTSRAENDFLLRLANQNTNLWRFVSPNRWYGPWLGAIQPPGSVEPAGGWKWVTEEPFVFQNWLPGQPNNTGGNENRVQFFGYNSRTNYWNDVNEGVGDYVPGCLVEYDCDPRSGGFYRLKGDSPFRLVQTLVDGTTKWKTDSTSMGEYYIEEAPSPTGPWRVVAYDRRATQQVSFKIPVSPWPSQVERRSDFMVGGLVCDYLSYKAWGGIWEQTDLMQVLKTNGFQWMRAWVTTVSSDDLRQTDPAQWGSLLPWKNEYWSSVEFAERILREAQDRGFRLDLVLFLSHTAAHAGTQDAPPEWAGRSIEETASLLEDYTYRTVSYYKGRGLNIELYEIGNEIEWGILNFRPGERIPIAPGVDRTADMNYMRSNVWNVEAVLLKSAIAGVKRADPAAKIVLHIDTLAFSPENLIARTFFQTMIEHGVVFDYAGLSLPYPSPDWWLQHYSARFWYERVLTIVEHLGQLGKPVIFCEGNYPHRPSGVPGPPMQDYDFSPEGQANWVRELLAFLTNQANVAGFFYWYPEYFPGMGASDPNSGNVQSTGLFVSETEIQPALREFRAFLPAGPQAAMP